MEVEIEYACCAAATNAATTMAKRRVRWRWTGTVVVYTKATTLSLAQWAQTGLITCQEDEVIVIA